MEENISQKEKEKAEEEMIEQAFQELLNDYLATKHRKRVEIITKAFNFANQAHKGIKRRSGEPYIMHPIAVAKIVCNEIGLGSTSICSALLHDVVEDTDYTVEDIENIFGPKIAQIVDGLTKISGGIFGDRASAQAENFKKLLLTMSDDIRVILIKIADRLHNMRTLGSMLPNKQFKIAGETLYIYAPHANRLHRRHPHRRHLVATFRLEVHEHGDRNPLPQEHDGGLRDSAPGFETGGGRGRAPVELGERDDEAAPVHHRRIETAAARYAKRHHEATVRPEKFRQHAST
jgi:GTP pyrophosphokinase